MGQRIRKLQLQPNGFSNEYIHCYNVVMTTLTLLQMGAEALKLQDLFVDDWEPKSFLYHFEMATSNDAEGEGYDMTIDLANAQDVMNVWKSAKPLFEELYLEYSQMRNSVYPPLAFNGYDDRASLYSKLWNKIIAYAKDTNLWTSSSIGESEEGGSYFQNIYASERVQVEFTLIPDTASKGDYTVKVTPKPYYAPDVESPTPAF